MSDQQITADASEFVIDLHGDKPGRQVTVRATANGGITLEVGGIPGVDSEWTWLSPSEADGVALALHNAAVRARREPLTSNVKLSNVDRLSATSRMRFDHTSLVGSDFLSDPAACADDLAPRQHARPDEGRGPRPGGPVMSEQDCTEPVSAIVPAEPGWYALFIYMSSDGHEVERAPVVAWHCAHGEHDGSATIVTRTDGPSGPVDASEHAVSGVETYEVGFFHPERYAEPEGFVDDEVEILRAVIEEQAQLIDYP
jgi:hypothetical protein